MAADNRSPARPRPPAEMGLIARALHGAVKLAAWLVAALVFSILIEWVGMLLLWRGAGAGHSRAMLAQELAWLPAELRESLFVSSPARFASRLSQGLYHYVFEATGITGLMHALDAAPASMQSGLMLGLRSLLLPARDYLAAAMNITQVFGLRLAALVLSSPVFVLFGLVGLTEGLVRRDLRRWRGGWESSFVYHHAKRVVLPLPVGAAILYLAAPVSVHPSLIVLPAAVLFSTALAIMAATFKKYL